MLTPRQEVILTDFGIAKILQQTNPKGPMTEVGVSIGTPAYMAPEQAQGLPDIGPTADIYSLGIVLYEMLTGRVPYIADTPLAVILKVINDPLPPPRAFSSDIPDTLQRVVLKATAKNPADRYPTAEALADGLKRSLSADPGTSVNISEATVIATAPPAKRRPPFLWLGVGFIILLLGLTALCGIILGPTIITALQRETPAPVATLGTAATSMPQTPSSTLSPTPTVPLASSATDTGTLIVFDDFDNPEFDGKWNEEIWTHDPEDSATIEQADGSLKLSRQTAQSSGLDYEPLTIGEIGFIEAALKLQDNIRASAGNVSIVISHEDWWLGCFVSGGSQEDDALASCDTSDNYAANGVTVPYNSWHTLRFEVDPVTAAVSFFVDGTHIGRYTPPDPEAFKQTQVAFTLAVWSEDGGLVTGYIDEVKVGQ
jgi:serine/threonine protein kinase